MHAFNEVACDDGNECTVGEKCHEGTCAMAGYQDCDDGNECTVDSCEPTSGCVHVPLTPCCGNGIPEEGEDCDDGNGQNDDGCTSDCDAWLAGWLFRTPVQVTEQTGTDLTEFQVEVTLNTGLAIQEGSLKADCADLRLCGPDKVSLLDFWVAEGCGGAETLIWVKADHLSGGSQTTIYAYYGNPLAESLSDPRAAMVWYDDFASASSLESYDKVVLPGDDGITGSTGGWSVSGGELVDANNNDSYGLLVKGLEGRDLVLQVRVRSGGDDDIAGLVMRYSGLTSSYGAVLCFGDTGWGAMTSLIGKNADANEDWQNEDAGFNSYGTLSIGVWHTLEVRIWGEFAATRALLIVNDQQKNGIHIPNQYSTPYQNDGRFGLRSTAMEPGVRFDDLVVRRFASPEPLTTNLQEESL